LKNILVIGGCGFIGSHLVDKLNEKHNVIVLDNQFSGNYKFSKTLYINDKSENINKHFKKIKIDLVYHFGEFSRINQSFINTKDCLDFNIKGTLEVIKFCTDKKIKLIYSASSAIQDNKQNLSPYAYSKYHNINLIKNYSKWFGLKYNILYFFNVYGPRQISSGTMATVIGIFEKQYKNKQPLTVVKPGTQRRNFTHIDDIVRGIIESSNKTNKEIMIGNKKSYSIIEVAKLFKTNIKYIKAQKGERYKSGKIINTLSFEPKINLKDYIVNFMSYM
tara:strand:- start:1678 stop:2505 length:828 start_codon:yes stop_codon:yes gene_type:complete